MNEIDLKNNEIVKSLVSKYFSFERNSLERFIRAVDEGIDIAPEYAEILKNSPDRRARFDVKVEASEREDVAWKKWREYYYDFYNTGTVSYSNFLENKLPDGKNEKKLGKSTIKWYKDNPISFLAGIGKCHDMWPSSVGFVLDFFRNNSISAGEFFGTLFDKKENVITASGHFETFEYVKRDEKDSLRILVRKNDKKISLYISMKKFASSKYYEPMVDYFMRKTSEKIGTLVRPKGRELQIVLSLNFVDWLLCSTAENWGSCLKLNSSYEAGFWSGLPGMIVDKNRALVYVTDGTKKEYRGMVVDHFIERSWVLAVGDGKVKKFLVVNGYPSGRLIFDNIKQVFGEKALSRSNIERSYRSLYAFEPLFHKSYDEKVLKGSFIYLDAGQLIDETPKEKTYSVRYVFDRSGTPIFYRKKRLGDFKKPAISDDDDDDDDDYDYPSFEISYSYFKGTRTKKRDAEAAYAREKFGLELLIESDTKLENFMN